MICKLQADLPGHMDHVYCINLVARKVTDGDRDRASKNVSPGELVRRSVDHAPGSPCSWKNQMQGVWTWNLEFGTFAFWFAFELTTL